MIGKKSYFFLSVSHFFLFSPSLFLSLSLLILHIFFSSLSLFLSVPHFSLIPSFSRGENFTTSNKYFHFFSVLLLSSFEAFRTSLFSISPCCLHITHPFLFHSYTSFSLSLFCLLEERPPVAAREWGRMKWNDECPCLSLGVRDIFTLGSTQPP